MVDTNRMPPAANDVIGRLAAGYTIERLIGEGGMGSVYRAIDHDTGKRAAVKIIASEAMGDESIAKRFLVEAKSLAAIDDPNVIEIYGSGRFIEDGRVYIVMPLVDGKSLEALCNEVGRLAIDIAVLIAVQIASGLDSIHQAGLVHRDIKPGNILVGRRWGRRYFVRIVDLGIVKALNPQFGARGVTMARTVIGTAGYMSPEQAQGEAEIDARADVYSLGATLYRMLTGRAPFEGESTYVIWEQQMQNAPIVRPIALRPELPTEIDEAVMLALEHDRARRLHSVKELAQRIVRPLKNGDQMLRFLASRLYPEVAAGPTDATFTADLENSMSRWDARSRSQRAPRRSFLIPGVATLAVGLGAGYAAARILGTRDENVAAASDGSDSKTVVASPPSPGKLGARDVSAATPAQPDAGSTTVPDDATAAVVHVVVDAASTGARSDAGMVAQVQPDAGAAHPTKPVEGTKVPKPARVAEPPRAGVLVVRVQTWADVYVDGNKLGTAPLRTPLGGGGHDVVLVNESHREKVPVTINGREAIIDKDW
jgi:serine/threonine-protein kinase